MSFDRSPKLRAAPKPLRQYSGPLRKLVLPEHVRVLEANDEVTFAVDHDVLIEIWRVRPTAELFARLDGHFRWLAEHTPRFAALSVIESPTPPDAAAREAGAALIRSY